jgi:hypothetical protein
LRGFYAEGEQSSLIASRVNIAWAALARRVAGTPFGEFGCGNSLICAHGGGIVAGLENVAAQRRREAAGLKSFAMLLLLAMSGLAEIEAAADALSTEQKQELLLYLVTRLRAQGARLPESRKFSAEQLDQWIAEDEADMRRFREGK